MDKFSRRQFMATTGAVTAGTLFHPLSGLGQRQAPRKRIALVGTGIRGSGFWGKRVVDNYSDIVEFVGLSDRNPGRLEYARKEIGLDCPIFTDFEEMMRQTKPDLLIVTTMDSTHHEFIIKGLEMGADVLTEKPLTIDEDKCQDILDAEARTGRNVIVGFNYRWGPYPTRIKELLVDQSVGRITSVDFHWYLNTYHGASYFRRWHGLRQCSGTLWVHKATHHFDLLNWWIDSDPVEVYAMGDLEHYGGNGKFRGDNCRTCPHKNECKFYWDITKEERMMELYVANEKYDGYIRDNCLFRRDINIYDKMSAQVRYANNVVVNYSLTTYSPFEGWRASFNGLDGRIESWLDIPWMGNETIDQAALHEAEMNQESQGDEQREPLIVHRNWNDYKVHRVSFSRQGHGGGDSRMQDKIFRNPDAPDPLHHSAGTRDGAMSILIGIAARKSIEAGRPIRISELTTLEPRVDRLV